MAKFIKADEIPADAKAIFHVQQTQDSETVIAFTKSVRTAKIAYNKSVGFSRGWATIEKLDREHGIMVW